MKGKFMYAVMALVLSTGTLLVSCDDDDDNNNNSNGNAVITFENVAAKKDFVQSGTFQMTGTAEPVILPGESVSITFNAGKGQHLMFATMYGYSNDIFFAPENPGINLFDSNGNAVTGNVSSSVRLWDNGTRVNQAPGTGVTHPGVAEAGNISVIDGTDAQGNTYLAASELMSLMLDYNSTTSQFTLTIANISGGTTNETPFSPGVWAVSNKLGDNLVNDKPFFEAGAKSAETLTAIAESGNNQPLADWVANRTGIITGLSPAVVVIYSGTTNPIFQLNQKDAGLGLKELAQKGDGSKLKQTLEGMSNVRQVVIVGNAPIAPGQKAEAAFYAWEGDNIAYATMFGSSNDWFYANSETVSSLIKGDLTSKTALFDNGTAVNQYPGAGNAQALFGGTPIVEDKVISRVDNTYPVPPVQNIIKVTIR